MTDHPGHEGRSVTGFTIGDIKDHLAPIVGVDSDKIDDYIIIVRGECSDCGGHDAFSVMDTADDMLEFIQLCAYAARTRMEADRNAQDLCGRRR